MNRTLIAIGAAASLLAPSVPVAAQATDRMARPVPLPQPVPNRPDRPNDNSNWGGNNPNNGNWTGAIIRCESRNNRRETCRADTRGGVRLVRQLSSQSCREGRSWGTRSTEIWVDNGCRGDFQLRYGSGQNSSSGPSAAAIIGGVAVAGGLIALLSQSNKSSAPPAATGNVAGQAPSPPIPPMPAPPAGPARITAQMGGVTPDARPSLQTCLNEAAREVGATGGTEIRLDRIDDVQAGNGGFRFRFQLLAVYPDETRTIATFCRATPTKVVELTFN